MNVGQAQFRAAILDPTHPVPEGLSDGGQNPAGARFNVYRNNVAVSLTEAMHTGFPIITKLLGAQNMDGLAGIFLRAHPPTSPLMMHYGAAFPDFLAAMPQLAHLGYLADVARLELALRRSYHAADADPVALDRIASLAPDRMLNATVSLAPSAVVLRSDWPIYDIWRFNTRSEAPKPTPGPQDILITRPDFDPQPSLLEPGGADWINALVTGQTLAQANQTALDNVPDFDPGPTLSLLLQGGALSTLNLKD